MPDNTRQLALCSLLAALALVLLSMGGILPLALYAAPILASLLLIPVMEECSRRYAWTWFAATALLGLLLGPDKEMVLLFCFLGYYPLLQPKIHKLPSKPLQLVVKLLFVCVSVCVMYALLLFLFQMETIVAEFRTAGTILLVSTALLGICLFFLYDQILSRFVLLYGKKRKRPSKK